METEEWHRWWKSRGASGLRSLLMTHWDPIGVSDVPEASDEYDSYMPGLAKMLRDGADTEAVAVHLAEIENKWMELPATPEQTREAANQITEWYSDETGAFS